MKEESDECDERQIVWKCVYYYFFFKFNAALMTDLSSRQELTITGVRFCDILHRFDFYMNFVFLLKFKKFYFLFYTINKKTQLPPFWFHQGDVLCYDSSTCMCTYTQVVWIVPNHFEIHFFTFQIIFFFKFSYLLHSTGALMLICFYPGLSPYFLLSIVFCVQYLMWWRICSTV